MSDDQARRVALARVIDPKRWEISDLPAVVSTQAARDALRAESLEIADRIIDSGLMVSVEWDRREYIRAKSSILGRTSRTGKCYTVEDGLDGYFMHNPRCPNWPDGAFGGSECIK